MWCSMAGHDTLEGALIIGTLRAQGALQKVARLALDQSSRPAPLKSAAGGFPLLPPVKPRPIPTRH